MKAEAEASEAAQSAAHFVGWDFGAGKEHASSENPKGKHVPIPNHVPGKRAGDAGVDHPGFHSSGREALLEAESFIQFFVGDLAKLNQVLTQPGSGRLRG